MRNIMETIKNGGKAALAALAAMFVLCAAADDWRDLMWERPVAIGHGVSLRAYALDEPRLMKAYVARIDLAAPGIGFTATERDPKWGQEVAVGTNKTVRVGLGADRQEYTTDFMKRRRAEGKNVVLAVNTSGWGPMKTKPGDLYRWAVSDGVEISYKKNPSRTKLRMQCTGTDSSCEEARRRSIPGKRSTRLANRAWRSASRRTGRRS